MSDSISTPKYVDEPPDIFKKLIEAKLSKRLIEMENCTDCLLSLLGGGEHVHFSKSKGNNE